MPSLPHIIKYEKCFKCVKRLNCKSTKLQHTCLAKHKNSCLDVQTKWFKENMFRIENVTKPFTYILINIFLWHDWQTNGPNKFYTWCSLLIGREYSEKNHLYILNSHCENYVLPKMSSFVFAFRFFISS